MLILMYFSLASKLQTLWSKDCGRVKHQMDKSCLKKGPKLFWSILCQGFTLLAQHFTLLAVSKLMTGTDTVQLHSNSVVGGGVVILINTKLPLKPPVTACIQCASPSMPFWWNPAPHATYFPLSNRSYWGGNFCIFSRDLHILSSTQGIHQD